MPLKVRLFFVFVICIQFSVFAVESVTEIFAAYMKPDGTIVCGPLSELMPTQPVAFQVITNPPTVKK